MNVSTGIHFIQQSDSRFLVPIYPSIPHFLRYFRARLCSHTSRFLLYMLSGTVRSANDTIGKHVVGRDVVEILERIVVFHPHKVTIVVFRSMNGRQEGS